MKKILFYIVAFLLAFSFDSCKDGEPEEIVKNRVVIFYMVAENSLLEFSSIDINEILATKSKLKNDEEIVIYLDNDENPAIYSITNKTKVSLFSNLSPEYRYATNQNSCSGTTLSEFLGYVKDKHKARSYGIVLWSHGFGWVPSSYKEDSQNFARRRSFGLDNGKNNSEDSGNRMSISELHSALQSFGTTFEYIFFDCCNMQCIEVDYELRDVAKYIIGSPAEIPGDGAVYSEMIEPMFSITNYAELIPFTYYNSYKDNEKLGVLISTVDCSKLDDLAEVTKDVVTQNKDTLLNASYKDVFDYMEFDKYGYNSKIPDFYDIKGIFLTYLSQKDYDKWFKTYELAVPYRYHTDTWYSRYPYTENIRTRTVDVKQFGGVSMYVPLEKYLNGNMQMENNSYFVNAFWQCQWAQKVWK